MVIVITFGVAKSDHSTESKKKRTVKLIFSFFSSVSTSMCQNSFFLIEKLFSILKNFENL